MSTGAVLGGALGLAWSLLGPGAAVGSYALIVPMLAATALAAGIDGYSIYSARLPA